MRRVFLFLLLAFGGTLDAKAQPDVSIGGSAGYLRLGEFDGPSLSAGGSVALPLEHGHEGGKIVLALWVEAAGMSVGDDPDRYFYNSLALACTDLRTDKVVSKAFCDGGTISTLSSLFEALYAPTEVGPFAFAFGGGVRYGEEVTRAEYEEVEQRLRLYGTAFIDAPVFSDVKMRVQGRVGDGISQVRAGLLVDLN